MRTGHRRPPGVQGDRRRACQVPPGNTPWPQRHRLYRAGVRRFFRLDTAPGEPLVTMGDCGAFSYINDDVPPYRPDEVIDFYDECGFDLGISIDHVIFGYDPAADDDADHPQLEKWEARQQLTLDLAEEFLGTMPEQEGAASPPWRSPRGGVRPPMRPLSVTCRRSATARIAIGGMVPLKTHEILACLQGDQHRPRPRAPSCISWASRGAATWRISPRSA